MKNQPLNFIIGKEALGFTVLGIMMAFSGILVLVVDVPPDLEGSFRIPACIGLIILGLALGLSFSGVLIDTKNKKIKIYTWILFFKVGFWDTIDDYQDILVLRKKRTFRMGRHGDHGADVSTSQVDFEIFLARKNHIDKVLIARKSNYEKAANIAREIADQLNFEWVKFNPAGRKVRKVMYP